MNILYKDFVPQVTDPGGFFKAMTVEDFEKVVLEANQWISSQSIKLINIETVVLPNINLPHEEGSTDTNISMSGEFSTYWNQFIRVWYQK